MNYTGEIKKLEENSKVEQEIQKDKNYLKVFMQPISQINNYQQEREHQVVPKPKVEMIDLTEQQMLKEIIMQSPLKIVVEY